jgi:hypothetical protein
MANNPDSILLDKKEQNRIALEKLEQLYASLGSRITALDTKIDDMEKAHQARISELDQLIAEAEEREKKEEEELKEKNEVVEEETLENTQSTDESTMLIEEVPEITDSNDKNTTILETQNTADSIEEVKSIQAQEVDPETAQVEEAKIVAGQNQAAEMVLEDMPPEEKEKIDAAYETEKPAIGKFRWFANKVAEKVFGKKDKKLDGIIEQSRKAFLKKGLVIALVLTPLIGTKSKVGAKAEHRDSASKEIHFEKKAGVEKSATTIDFKEAVLRDEFRGDKIFNSLSENSKKIFLYNQVLDGKKKEPYVIVDKPTATAYIFDSNNQLVKSFPVLLGQTKGESPNIANTKDSIPTGATTPRGTFRFGEHHIVNADIQLYKGKIFSIYGTENLAIHITYPKQLAERTKALNTPTVEDNRKSWGCINISEENFDAYVTPTFGDHKSHKLYITPDDSSAGFTPEF